MRLRNIRGAEEAIADSLYTVQDVEYYKGRWKELFGNNNDIYVEIGMGKGKFIIENALRSSDINYIGIEKYSSVLLRAVQKAETLELNNLKLISMKAEDIEKIFEKDEVKRIYLNFSDPWPKDRHAKRRLTSKEFLERYDKVLSCNGTIEFKTDNKVLFDFTLDEVNSTKWIVKYKTYDLHNDEEMVKNNIMTEYESKFVSLGNKICKLIINR